MSDNLPRVRAGDKVRLKARTFNVVMEATEAYLRSPRAGASAGPPQLAGGTNVVRVRNRTGSGVIPRWTVVGLDQVTIHPSENLAEFLANPIYDLTDDPPIDSRHRGRFGILLEPVLHLGIGRAAVAGECPVRLWVRDDEESVGCCDVLDRFSDYYGTFGGSDPQGLITNPSGSAQILWREGGTGEQWARVRLGHACGVPALGSGTGSGSGGGVYTVGHGTFSACSGSSAGSDTVTVAAGHLLVVEVALPGDGTAPSAVTFDGNPMTLGPSAHGTHSWVGQYAYDAAALTSGPVTVAFPGGTSKGYGAIVEVVGLTDNALFGSSGTGGVGGTPALGGLATPATGIVLGTFLHNAGALGAWEPPLASGGHDVTACSPWKMQEGGKVYQGTGGASVVAQLDGITPGEWVGVAGAYS